MLDLYCERLGPGLWAEPINVITNLAFFIAAWGGWLLASRQRTLTAEIWLLIVSSVCVGIGSGLFHTFATPWARTLDLVFIFLFQLAFLWTYFRRIGGVHPVYAAALVFAFLAVSLWARQFPEILNRSLSYLPALFVLLALGAYHYLTHRIERSLILGACLIFLISLVFRTVDGAVCPYFPLGTHSLWHILNALLLYQLMKALIRNFKYASSEAESPA